MQVRQRVCGRLVAQELRNTSGRLRYGERYLAGPACVRRWPAAGGHAQRLHRLQDAFERAPPSDGRVTCLIPSGDNFTPTCAEFGLFGGLVLALMAAAGGAAVTSRVVRRRLAARDHLIHVRILQRWQSAAAALGPHLVERDALVLGAELGAGRFGRVRRGTLRRGARLVVVAVKTLREGAAPAEEGELLREACTLAPLQHAHVVRLEGVCAAGGPPLLIMEHAFHGDLLGYLRARRHLAESGELGGEADHVSAAALTRLVRGASSALAFLAGRRLVHRDVRAANCVVDARRTLKLADFGMARRLEGEHEAADEYACRRRGLFPVLWMAPESLSRGAFSVASDVWALGVLALEVVSLGERPYGEWSPLRVLQYVVRGGRPPLPSDVSPAAERVTHACWQREPAERPSARRVEDYLRAHPEALRAALSPARTTLDADSGFAEEEAE